MISQGTRDAVLPWDIFFGDGPRVTIDAWRRSVWKNIKRELRVEFGLEVPDGLEPHWTDPGTAIFYTMDKTVMWETSSEKRHNLKGFETIDADHWTVTSPMPVGNAQQLSRYLTRKGFRLRPPLDGVDGRLREVVESASSPEVSSPDYTYKCKVHGVEFLTWRGYLQHCTFKREQVDLSQMPESSRGAVGDWGWYCAPHNFGTHSGRAAKNHMKVHVRKQMPGQHSTVEQMRVKKTPATAGAKEKE